MVVRNIPNPNTILFITLLPRLTPRDVGGWQNTSKMGLNVLVAYDVVGNEWFSFTTENLAILYKLFDAVDAIIGFNLHSFTYPILRKIFDPEQVRFSNWFAKSFDLQRIVRMESGELISLNSLLKSNGLPIAKGLPIEILIKSWRRGNRKVVNEILRRRVSGLVMLYNHAAKAGKLAYRTHHDEYGIVNVQTPTDVLCGE